MDLNGITVGVVDERGEISAMYKGQAENDLGIRTDILNNVNKNMGIEMLIRSMSPKVIVCDEIGNKNDVQAIYHAICSGIKGVFTAHGSNIEYLESNPIFNEMLKMNIFERIIFLDNNVKEKIVQVFDLKNKKSDFATCPSLRSDESR